MVPLSFAGRNFVATRDGALFDPASGALFVADLHLEKASWYARFGQMLPPYDSLATLTALRAEIARFAPVSLWCLGDNFHDGGGPARIGGAARALLDDIGRFVDLHWIVGNHDPELTETFGGTTHDAAMVGGLALRHIARPAAPRDGIDGTLSGHFHPKLRLTVRGRRVARACFVRSTHNLILPAFGSLTGGLDAFDRAIVAAAGADVDALVVAGDRLVTFAHAVTETMAG